MQTFFLHLHIHERLYLHAYYFPLDVNSRIFNNQLLQLFSDMSSIVKYDITIYMSDLVHCISKSTRKYGSIPDPILSQ